MSGGAAQAREAAPSAKVDLKKELRLLYQPSAKEIVEVDVPTFSYLMIDGGGADVLEAATAQVRKKGRVAADRLRLETFAEGRCAQVLHVGPFSEEGPTIARLHRFIEERGRLTGKHHEIYLTDIRRADPRKWRTVIRQPML